MNALVQVCVFDVETRVSPDARALLPTGDRATVARSALLEVTAASVLEFELGDGVGGFSLITATTREVGEASVLGVIDAALARTKAADGLIISHNGAAHDLPTCARRVLHHWMFDASGLLGWWKDDDGRHIDTLLAFGGRDRRGPSLVDLAAGLGFSASVPARNPLSQIDPLREKVEVDVVATAVCYLFLVASQRRSGHWLAEAWRELSRFLLAPGVRAPHLMPLARIGMGIADERGR